MTNALEQVPEIPADAADGLVAAPAGPAHVAPAQAPAQAPEKAAEGEPVEPTKEVAQELRAARNLTWGHQGARTVQAAQGLVDRLQAQERPLSPMEQCKKAFAEGYIKGYKAVDGWKNGITNSETREALAKHGDRPVLHLDSLKEGAVNDMTVVATEKTVGGSHRVFAQLEGTNYLVSFKASRDQIRNLGDTEPLIGDKLLLTKKQDRVFEVVSAKRGLELADKLTVTKGREARSAGMER